MNSAARNRLVSTGAAAFLAFLALGGLTPASDAAQRAVPEAPRAAANAQSTPAALDGVRPGLWTVTGDEAGGVAQRLCLENPAMLVQVRHPGTACSRLVLASGKRDATVHYSCPGAGWGRTSLRVQGADAVSIDTQGIADSAPFAFKAEARREGECGGEAR